MSPIEIIEFWFSARVRPRWFSSTPRFDEEIAERFGSLWERAARGGLDGWADTPEGALALVVILDQFPLNMFRGDARSFSTEAAAIAVTKAALVQGLDRPLPPDQRAFLYMPLMHSEVLADQERLPVKTGVRPKDEAAEKPVHEPRSVDLKELAADIQDNLKFINV